MIIKSNQVIRILAHLDKLWDRKKEFEIAKNKHRIHEHNRELRELKEELLNKLTDPTMNYNNYLIVSHNKEQVIIKVDTFGEYIVTPPNPKLPYGRVEYKESI